MPEGNFDKDGFSLKPHDINDDFWFYDGKKGLTVAMRLHGTMQSIVGCHVLPWRRLEPSFKRYLAHKKRAQKKRAKVKSR